MIGTDGAEGLGQRPARPGERCTCGRPAVLVFPGPRLGVPGYYGRPDGGDRSGPCPFCHRPRHDGRCPHYHLTSDNGGAEDDDLDDESDVSWEPVSDAPAWYEGGPDR